MSSVTTQFPVHTCKHSMTINGVKVVIIFRTLQLKRDLRVISIRYKQRVNHKKRGMLKTKRGGLRSIRYIIFLLLRCIIKYLCT